MLANLSECFPLRTTVSSRVIVASVLRWSHIQCRGRLPSMVSNDESGSRFGAKFMSPSCSTVSPGFSDDSGWNSVALSPASSWTSSIHSPLVVLSLRISSRN